MLLHHREEGTYKMPHVEQRLGNYRLTQLLGTGIFADVYLGEHFYLNTLVAIKVLRSRLDSSTLADFLTEARHISHLVHPHIIRVFDFGLEAEAPFLVMDYAPHGNLRQLYPPRTIVPLPNIVSLVMALASALQYAHDQHLVHCDLKPENVLLGPKREVLLSDFGLALLTSDRASVQVKERFGTLSYMAPELILGQPAPASDQYTLAVMVYEWLCGQLPFGGLTDHLVDQHLHTDPPALCEKHPVIPRAVEQVVFKALSKESAERFVDVLSFAMALEEASHAVSLPKMFSVEPTATPLEADASMDGAPVLYRNIPVPLTPLIGRERELQTARDLLQRPEVRLVTLTGTGGIGKTLLALSLGNEVLEEFAQGGCFVSLSTTFDSELVMPAIAQALRLQESGNRSAIELLTAFLHDKQLLLVLDNFEQVLPAAPHLADLLSSCPGLKLLVTSRAVLNIESEYECRIQPLEVPDMRHVPKREALSQVASVALFVQRAQAALPGFQLTDENSRDIAGICSRLEGIPLSLTLAAARCKLLSPQALLSRLENPIEVLTGGRRDAPPRHQTLRNALSWNDDLLSSDEQTLFRRLAVFVGGCSLPAVEAILTATGGMSMSVLDGITALIDKSMLQHSVAGKDEPRLYLLEALREYGLESLTENGELGQTRDAHAAYYLELAEEAVSVLPGTNHTIWQERLEWEVENLRAAMEWLLKRHHTEEALRLATALEQFWLSGDNMSEGHGFLEQALEAVCESDTLVTARVIARALRVADDLKFNQKGSERVVEGFEERERISRQRHDQKDIAAIMNSESNRRHYRDHLALASTEPRSRPSFEALTTREVEVLCLLTIGLSNRDIAERLVVSRHTVSGHVQSIFGKLAVNSRSGATRYAVEHNLV
jgi:predicted ATPase/DNA-binding CsgD family transcriptional regulator